MTDEPILEVPGYTRPEPPSETPPSPRGPLIDSVPFSAPMPPPEEPVPPRAAGFIDSVPAASTPWADATTGVFPASAIVSAAAPALAPPPYVPVAAPAPTPPPPPPPPYVPEAAPAPTPPDLTAPPVPAPVEPPVVPPTPAPVEPDNPFADWLADDDNVDVTRRVVRAVATVTLTWDDGTVTTITSPTLLGRNPTGTVSEAAVRIVDTTLSLSKTHARVTASPPAIEDLDSTNGVAIERNGVHVPLPPRESTSLTAGDVVVFGNRRAAVEVVS